MHPASQRLDYVPALTGLRGVAAALVLCFHLWQFAGGPRLDLGFGDFAYPLHAFAATGFLGVDLFFVLSAFLLSQPFLATVLGRRPWPKLATFYARRVLRVVPAFWVQLAVLFVVGWIVAGAPPFGAGTLVAHALFAQHLFAGLAPINPVYWSLPVEWWFYFTLPVFGWAFGKVRWWLLLVFVLASAVTFRLACWHWLYDGQWHPWANYGAIMHLRARLDQFFLGIVAAWFHLQVVRDSRWRGICAAVGLLGLVALLPSLAARGDLFVNADYPYVLIHYPIVGALFALVVFGAAGGIRWLLAAFANRALAWVGMVSYSLYLWHYPVLGWLRDAGMYERAGAGLGTLVALAASLFVACLSYRFVEKRFLPDLQ